MLRAQICQKLKRHGQALIDIRHMLTFDKNNFLAHEKAGDLYAALNNYKLALKEYDIAVVHDEKILEKKIEMLYKCKEYNEVIKECEKLNMNENQVKILFYKGKSLKCIKQADDAIIVLEQVITLDYSNDWTIKALYCIAKIRAKQKNFYEAHYTLNRLPNDIQCPKITTFRNLIEGVYLLL